MRYDVSIPQFVGPEGVDGVALSAYLHRAEALGFTGAWTLEQALGPTPLLAPLETLSYAAALTERIRLGVAVLVTSLGSPLHLAGSIASVDLLSHGRLDVGISAGGGFRDFAAFGVDRATFVARFVEGLRIMKAAWADGRVDLDGRFFTVHADVGPQPVQRPRPPVWFGASARTSLRRAARHGDAFMGAGSVTTDRFAGQVTTLRRALEEAGRDPSGFPIGKRVYLAVDDDAEAARAAVLAGLRRIYGPSVPQLDEVAVAGTPADVAAGLQEVIDAGAGTLLLNPLADDHEQLERLAAEVLPHLP
ncbi:conserved hypothetical protein [Nostocoides japonicum T1-X7]|uniref:Luciferase-like domain-containing protein n=1 Tax=Nostocoides japonicum T1-X7 TaxID=1194083 RepID=A0A077LZA2_9MICO|nr:LLM class flavin-dependent oxidoreductase [Tetrasphaera japonica]CCH78971.1 conserved hypothetical protein [Tetrasphaera japonica T1-X7]